MRHAARVSESDEDPSPLAVSEPGGPRHVRRSTDGHRILVRPLVASDRDELATRYDTLSASARRARFGSAPNQLSERQLDELLDLDYDDRFAFAAVALDEPGAPGVGVARYARHRDNPGDAEAAVVVLDTYQHRGIGTMLLLELVEVARAHGITAFVATVLWDNNELLDALRSRGATVEPAEPGVAAVRMELSDVGRSAGS